MCLSNFIQAATALAVAGMESYRRAYPLLARLHVLHEIEDGRLLRQNQKQRSLSSSAPSSVSLSTLLEEQHHWHLRLEMTSPSINHLSLLLAVRRSIFEGLSSHSRGLAVGSGDPVCVERDSKLAGEWRGMVADNWLCLSQSLRQLRKFDCARIAIRNAETCGLDEHIVTMEECRLLKDAGQVGLIFLYIKLMLSRRYLNVRLARLCYFWSRLKSICK